jgi:hypothetical protein
MTAQEARNSADNVNTADNDSQYDTIVKMIKQAAGEGKYSTWIYNVPIKDSVSALLKRDGYKVGPTQSDRGETLTEITW